LSRPGPGDRAKAFFNTVGCLVAGAGAAKFMSTMLQAAHAIEHVSHQAAFDGRLVGASVGVTLAMMTVGFARAAAVSLHPDPAMRAMDQSGKMLFHTPDFVRAGSTASASPAP
jgi:hypothetical protein